MRPTDNGFGRRLRAALVLGLAATALVTADGAPSAGCSSSRTSQFLTVNTTNGPITGHVAPDTTSICVIEYLGIPYAKPPVGDLRFAAPQPIDVQSNYTAASFGFDCPLSPSKAVAYPNFTSQAQRIINYFASGAGTPQSEDCLTLNIWSQATPLAAVRKKPVIVFFYGGRKFVCQPSPHRMSRKTPRSLPSQASPSATPTAPSTTASTSPRPRTWSW